MEKSLYLKIYEHEKTYWWAVNKRKYLFNLVDRYVGSMENKRVLDVGCGTGCLLSEFKTLKNAEVYGLDYSQEAKKFCEINGLNNIFVSPAEMLPFKDEEFDLVTSLDVLEHVENDTQALKECSRVLKTGGIAVFSVPAFNFLWTNRDVRLMHKRRYEKNNFNSMAVSVGLEVLYSRYVNLFVVPPLWVSAKLSKFAGRNKEASTIVAYYSPFVNHILNCLNYVEYKMLDRINLPLGSSFFTIVRKL